MKYSDIYNLCKKIHPIYRSITGKGNKKTLQLFIPTYTNLQNIIKKKELNTKCTQDYRVRENIILTTLQLL